MVVGELAGTLRPVAAEAEASAQALFHTHQHLHSSLSLLVLVAPPSEAAANLVRVHYRDSTQLKAPVVAVVEVTTVTDATADLVVAADTAVPVALALAAMETCLQHPQFKALAAVQVLQVRVTQMAAVVVVLPP